MTTIRSLIVGDPSDPWTQRLVAQTPRPRLILDASADLPDRWPDLSRSASAVLVHVAHWDTRLAAMLRLLRRELPPPTPWVLCQHPLNRYPQVEPYAPLFSSILSEATARAVLARHLTTPNPVEAAPSIPVAVVSNLTELGLWLAAAVQAAGFEPRLVRDWHAAAAEPIAVWDLPHLDPGWEPRLQREARRRAVLVVAHFLDRPLVDRLERLGARAALDLPCDADDLAFLLHDLAAPLAGRSTLYLDPPSLTPPRPHVPSRLRRHDLPAPVRRNRTSADPPERHGPTR
ncbi:MAG: hypothetical protein KatS3mg108_1563 [Isosphaeraceae bacterium]|jgi:hypothetical protein|nr:MAG: hypothetical protein KatS3mg108_1563 [Isosphaeraceae bacterium]